MTSGQFQQAVTQLNKPRDSSASGFNIGASTSNPNASTSGTTTRRSLATSSYVMQENAEERLMCESGHNQTSCLFAFSSGAGCTPTGKLLVGGLCAQHNKSCLNRTMVEMVSVADTSITSVCHRQLNMTTLFPLVSFIPMSHSLDRVKTDILKNKNDLSASDGADIATLYYALAQPDMAMLNDSAATSLKTYLNHHMAQHYETLNHEMPRMKSIKLLHIFSEDYAQKMQDNEWFMELCKEYQPSKDAETGQYTMAFTMSKLCYIDLLLLRGFHINTVPGRVDYEPNWAIYNGQLICGLGYGINNVLKALEDQSEEKRNRNYRPQLRDLIAKAGLPMTLNLDANVLSSVIDGTCPSVYAELTLEVSPHHNSVVTFDPTQVKFNNRC